jgi:hypothetical protein
MKKLVFVLLAVAALFMLALPAAAQGPAPAQPLGAFNWAQFTSPNTACTKGSCAYTQGPRMPVTNPRGMYLDGKEFSAVLNYDLYTKSTLEDPFGGWPARGPFNGLYTPGTALFGGWGVGLAFGPSPSAVGEIPNGGIPSRNTGDGTSPRRAIMIGGVWKGDADANTWKNDAGTPNPIELPTCATATIPAGQSRWFKTDTWRRSPDGTSKVKLQLWLDEEVNGAKAPSGSSVWGAASLYTWGVSWPGDFGFLGPADDWTYNTAAAGERPGSGFLTGPYLEGFYMAVYDPDAMKPNYAFPAPNATLYTLNVSGATQSLRRSCSAAVYAGQTCVPGVTFPPSGASATGILFGNPPPGLGMGYNAVSGLGQFNRAQPSHLLWYETTGDGWYHIRVYNQMVWDGTVTVCAYRAYESLP